MSDTPVAEMSFEQAMAELDQVVSKLENGDVPLEDLVKYSQRGAELKSHCEAKLKEAVEKIEKITVGVDGSASGTTPAEGL